ncbi:hypothetical protein FD723_41140 (plasmid) [Nostoc sp. C052]|uniref:hypothetical protein n=1 Tax=Nostoc sp. C052 TaxID=2576902 RepID=UPI0015C374F6|nr:hypothetical protein [Nostoc sp. C052]QLE46615.1 hypothetical protein FD723_41140 [Nostoc sp. C052]
MLRRPFRVYSSVILMPSDCVLQQGVLGFGRDEGSRLLEVRCLRCSRCHRPEVTFSQAPCPTPNT